MKRKSQTLTKRTKIVAIIVAVFLACALIVSGVMLFKGQDSLPASADTPSKLTITAYDANDESTPKTSFNKGDVIYFEAEYTTVTDRYWFAVQTFLIPFSSGAAAPDLCQYMTLVVEDWDNGWDTKTPINFDSPMSVYVGSVNSNLDYARFKENSGLMVMMYKQGNARPTSRICKFGFYIKIADNMPDSTFSFGMKDLTTNLISTVPSATGVTSEAVNHTAYDATFSIVCPTLTIGEGGGDTPTPPKSSDSTLSGLGVTSGGKPVTLSPSFSSGRTEYTAEVDDIDAAINVTPTVNDTGKATATHTTKTNPDGSKTITVTVTAEDGSTTDYTVTVTEKGNDNPTPPGPDIKDSSYAVSTITVSGNGVNYLMSFIQGTKSYTVSVPYSVETADISITTSSSKATTVGTGSKTLQEGMNGPYRVYAVAEDGSNNNGADSYSITIIREAPADDALLSQILVDNYDDGSAYLIKNFNPSVTTYKVFVPSDADLPRITAIAADTNAEIIMYVNDVVRDDGNKGKATDTAKLPAIGDSVIVRFVVSLDGKTKEYTVTLTRSSETPYLTYLTVGNYQLYDANNKAVNGKDENAVRDVMDFYVTIENADTSVYIEARANAEDAEVRIQNNGYFSVDSLFGSKATADVQISVVPQYGDIVLYYVHLTRKPAVSSNTNAFITIDEITDTYHSEIADKTNAMSFNNEFLQYGDTKNVYGTPYHIPYDVATLTVTVRFEDQGEMIAPPTYEIFYGDVLKNNNGVDVSGVHLAYGVNVVLITITASDGYSSRTIAVIVYRDEPSLFPNPSIKEIPEFTNEYCAKVTDYAYTVANDIDKLTVLFLKYDDSLYTCMISDNANDLKVGLNTVTISLFERQSSGVSKTAASHDVSGAVRTITLSIFRESNAPSTIWLVLFIIFLILAILEFIILLLLLLRNRNDNGPTTHRVVVAAPAPAPMPAPAPVVKVQPAPVQYVAMPQPQVQYVQVPQPQPQPIEVPKPSQPLNVEVNITGCGENDGHYKTRK